jgi:hypothetical protein
VNRRFVEGRKGVREARDLTPSPQRVEPKLGGDQAGFRAAAMIGTGRWVDELYLGRPPGLGLASAASELAMMTSGPSQW